MKNVVTVILVYFVGYGLDQFRHVHVEHAGQFAERLGRDDRELVAKDPSNGVDIDA